MNRLLNYLLEAIRSPREQLSRGQQFLRKSIELVVYCYRQLERQRADGMAAELTYRTIFALIPVVVLGLVMFRLVGGLEDVQAKVENQLFSFFGVPEITEGYEPILPKQTPDGTTPPADSSPDASSVDNSAERTSNNVEAKTASNTGSANRSPDKPPTTTTETEQPALASNSTESQTGNTAVLPGAQSLTPAQLPELEVSNPLSDSGSSTAEAPTAGEKEFNAAQQARISIRRTLHDLADKVSSVDFASIGVFGLLLFTYAAVALANAAEHLFNRIYEAPSKRPAHLRLAIHWSILTLGGGLLAMSLYLSGQLVEWFGNLEGSETLKPFLTHCVSLLASWILLFLVYALMPNTRVSVKAAAIGSAVSAVLWEIAKYGFQIYLSEAVPYSVYGSLGLIPLFLFWIYLTWLLVLFGLILTYTLQALGGHLPEQFEIKPSDSVAGDPDWMLPIMCEIASCFESGEIIDHQTLSDRIGLSSRNIHDLTTHLLDAKFLLQVNNADEQTGLTLSRPAEQIQLVDILDLAQRIRPPHQHKAWDSFTTLKQAERQAVQGKTLAEAAF